MFKRFLISALIASSIFFIMDLLWYAWMFKAFYAMAQANIGRGKVLYFIMFANDIYRGAIFAFVYLVLVRNPRSLIHGVVFGMCTGLLLSSTNGSHYALLHISSFRWLFLEGANFFIQTSLVGILLPSVFWATPKKVKLSTDS